MRIMLDIRSTRIKRAKLVALAALGFAIASCTTGGAEGVPPAMRAATAALAATARPVRLTTPRAEILDARVRAVGTVEPRDRLDLGFKVGGVVARVTVDEGDDVEPGEVLAELDRTEIDAAVERAAQAAAKAERDLKRAQALYADDVATLEQVEDATTASDVARADLSAARFNARYARVVATTRGVVLRRLADPTEVVAAGAPVLVVGSLARGWRVRAAVADRDVVQIAVGDAATVRIDAFPEEEFAATVERIATASDPATGTYAVDLAIEPNGRRFVQGLVAKVTLDAPSRAADRLWIPVEALLEANGGHAKVFVVDAARVPGDASDDEARVAERSVAVGSLVGDLAEVRAGLRANERVVTDGAAWLTDGDLVTVAAGAR